MRRCRILSCLLITVSLCLVNNLRAQDIPRIKITEIEKRIAESASPLIINFWATFCIPCVEEMPHFQKLANEYAAKGVQLLFVSLDLEDDYPARVKDFAGKLKITAPVVWLDEFDADYFCPKIDPQWSGAIPATLFVNNSKNYRHFSEQALSEEQLRKAIEAMLIGGAGQ